MVAAAGVTLAVLVLGMAVPLVVVDQRVDEYEGERRDAVASGLSEIGQRQREDLVGPFGVSRVSTFRVTDVERCAAERPRAYSVEVEFLTIFGVSLGRYRLSCDARPA